MFDHKFMVAVRGALAASVILFLAAPAGAADINVGVVNVARLLAEAREVGRQNGRCDQEIGHVEILVADRNAITSSHAGP